MIIEYAVYMAGDHTEQKMDFLDKLRKKANGYKPFAKAHILSDGILLIAVESGIL